MKHSVISYENALKIAERNYYIPCDQYYDTNAKLVYEKNGTFPVPAPSQSLTQKYFREKLNTSVEPYAAWQNKRRIGYSVSIALANNDNVFVEDSNDCSKIFNTYEEALDAGLEEALKYI